MNGILKCFTTKYGGTACMPSKLSKTFLLATILAVSVGCVVRADEPLVRHSAPAAPSLNGSNIQQLQAVAKPRVVGGKEFAKELGKVARVDEKQMSSALKEASEHIRALGESHWVKAGGKWFKFVGKAKGPCGLVVQVASYSTEAAEIEQKFERSELTREQADVQQAKLALSTIVIAGGELAGTAAGTVIGTFICPGSGTVIGGVVGERIGGYIAAEVIMAASGLHDTLGEFLSPRVETLRQACAFAKEKGVEVAVFVKDKTVDAAVFVKDKTVDAAVFVKDKTVAAAVIVKDKTVDAAVFVKDKTVAAAVIVKDKTVDAAVFVKDKTVAAAVIVKGATVEAATVVGDALSDGRSMDFGYHEVWLGLSSTLDSVRIGRE